MYNSLDFRWTLSHESTDQIHLARSKVRRSMAEMETGVGDGLGDLEELIL